MGTETAAEASREGQKIRDRRVQRTVDLSEPEIAAVVGRRDDAVQASRRRVRRRPSKHLRVVA
jgi:hypothetical protein